MKTIFLILALLASLPSFAVNRVEIEALLREKGVELRDLESRGMQTLMGEVTGHISLIPFSKVQILITDQEAILKKEIDGVDFSGSQIMGSIISVRFNGQYVTKQDVKATIISK